MVKPRRTLTVSARNKLITPNKNTKNVVSVTLRTRCSSVPIVSGRIRKIKTSPKTKTPTRSSKVRRSITPEKKKIVPKTPKSVTVPRPRRISKQDESPSTNPAKNEDEEDDGIQTRRVQKNKSESGPKCSMCKNLDSDNEEELNPCSECGSSYHIHKCLKYPIEFAKTIQNTKLWLCAKCVRCAKCAEFISDPSNIECWECCNAWHGSCAPKGHQPNQIFDGPWYCAVCCKKKGFTVPITPNKKSSDKEKKSPIEKIPDSAQLKLTDKDIEAIMQERNKKWDNLIEEAGLSSPTKSVSSPKKMNKDFKKGGRRVIFVSPHNSLHSQLYGNGASTSGISTNFDTNLFKNVQSTTKEESPADEDGENDGQWVYMGDGRASRVLYPSAYPENVRKSKYIYICKFCLHATHSEDEYQIHWDNCSWTSPPGNEIYRNQNLSFFEVDGAVQKNYCRNLCLMAKMFISSKTLYHEVETFLFYILCEITEEGFVIVGYFSKEKNPSKNNNLSCLLTLPTAQRMGYGRLLIDMSYALSRLELKIGSPEHPLSDLGVLAYRGYWRSSILCYLRSIRSHHHVSIKEISMNTRIHPVDIVNQMLKDNMLSFKHGSYYIKTGKRAFKHPLSQVRRRSIDMKKMIWKPKKEDLNGLDPSRLNYYV